MITPYPIAAEVDSQLLEEDEWRPVRIVSAPLLHKLHCGLFRVQYDGRRAEELREHDIPCVMCSI